MSKLLEIRSKSSSNSTGFMDELGPHAMLKFKINEN